MNVGEAKSVLEIMAANPTAEEVDKHYKIARSRWHPDKNPGDEQNKLATEQFKQVTKAYEVLSEILEEAGEAGLRTWETSSRSYQPRHRYRQKVFTPGFPDETVPEEFVKSSHIVSVGYNALESRLYIKFDGDKVYEYFSVPETIYTGMITTNSPGRFANSNIYKAFDYRRCTEANRPYVGRHQLG